MSPEEIQKLLIQKQQDMGQRAAAPPMNLNTATDPELQSYRGQHAAKIQELYEADKRLADRYANPESEVYLNDPYAREKARATQSQATAGEITDIMSKISERKSYLEDSYEKGLKIWQLGLEAQKQEFAALNDIFGNAMKMKEAEESRSGKADSASQKAKEGEYLIYFMSNEVANRDEALASAREIIKKNPEDYDVIMAIVNQQFPEEKAELFGYSESEVRAGVAGKPKNNNNMKKYQNWLNQNKGKKQSTSEMLMSELAGENKSSGGSADTKDPLGIR